MGDPDETDLVGPSLQLDDAGVKMESPIQCPVEKRVQRSLSLVKERIFATINLVGTLNTAYLARG